MSKMYKYKLENSYFKNRYGSMPDSILEIVKYEREKSELPFDYKGENFVYDSFCERQKKKGIFNSQILTPNKTASLIADLAFFYAKSKNILDACCGTGQLSKALTSKGFYVQGFDVDAEMVEICNLTSQGSFYQYDYREINPQEIIYNHYDLIVSNPPYELSELKDFFKFLTKRVAPNGYAILLIPNGFIDKKKPTELVSYFEHFKIVHRERMSEPFLRASVFAEIVVLQK